MGMVLEHELTASYAAGSLGGTQGRLKAALIRLYRMQPKGFRDHPGVAFHRFSEPVALAALNQTLRSVADAWARRKTPRPRFSQVDDAFSTLKENALNCLAKRVGERRSADPWSEYQLLAQDLDNLRSVDRQHI